ncbi:MAG: hypothetical protein QOD12_1034 [Verrucomicrobiota bacterium]|jgi:hypothetical protein
MAIPKVAALFADRLNGTGAKWMATGSIAAMTYGEYRTTNDVDVVMVLGGDDPAKLATAFPSEEFYCPPVDVLEMEAARDQCGHFNLIHHDTGFKADIYLAGNDPLSHWALERRREIQFHESIVWVAPPEYVIIGKLEFYREGGSEKHLRDIRGILAMTEIDRIFLEKEIAMRGLEEVWRTCQSAN